MENIMEETTQVETPQELPQEPQEQQATEPQEHEEVETPEVAPETAEVQEEVETPVAEAPDEIEEEETFEFPTIDQVKPLTQEDLQVDPETGNVDVAALLETFNSRIQEAVQVSTSQSVAEVTMQNKYKEAWNAAEAKYPELKTDKGLRDMVHAVHADTVQPGKKYLSPLKAAEKLLAIRTQGKTEGIQAATQSTKIQESARLETSTNQSAVSNDRDLQERLNSNNPQVAEQARREKLAQLIKSGKL